MWVSEHSCVSPCIISACRTDNIFKCCPCQPRRHWPDCLSADVHLPTETILWLLQKMSSSLCHGWSNSVILNKIIKELSSHELNFQSGFPARHNTKECSTKDESSDAVEGLALILPRINDIVVGYSIICCLRGIVGVADTALKWFIPFHSVYWTSELWSTSRIFSTCFHLES